MKDILEKINHHIDLLIDQKDLPDGYDDAYFKFAEVLGSRLTNLIIACENDASQCKVLATYYNEVILLLDQLYQYAPQKVIINSKSRQKSLMKLIDDLEARIFIIERCMIHQSKQLLSHNEAYIRISSQYIKKRFTSFSTKLHQLVGDEELKAAILQEVKKLMDGQSIYIDFHIPYLKVVVQTMIQQQEETETESNLIYWCIYNNFNSLAVFEHIRDQYIHEIENQEDESSQFNVIAYLTRNIQQCISSPITGLYPGKQNLQNKLLAWLKYEYRFHNRIKNNKAHHLEQSKMKTGMTVAQLSLLSDLLYSCRVLQPKDKKSLHYFISRNFSTKGSQIISTGSLRTKRYNLKTNEREEMIRVLHQILDQIKDQ